jgi:hypothetical protein
LTNGVSSDYVGKKIEGTSSLQVETMTTPLHSKAGTYPESHRSSLCVEGPPEESFDEKYNKRMEFPLSLVSAIFVHVLVGAVLVVLLVYAIGAETDKSPTKMSLVNLEGLDEKGSGAVGSGGNEVDLKFKDEGFAETDLNPIVNTPKLPEVRENRPNPIVSPDTVQNKKQEQPQGGKQGTGLEKGSGNDNSQGPGPGGKGTDSTQARNMRWVLRFKVESGRDYIEQLKAMGAEIIFQVPDSERIILIADLGKPKEQKQASEEDQKRLAKKVKFNDSREQAVKSVIGTLGLENVSPKSFWAFFPKEVEDEIARKELNYRNRRSEDIEETVFRVRVKDGKYEILVEEQRVKK